MTYTPRTTEEAARHTIDGLTDDLLGLINPANDGMLAAWQMALERGKEIVMALETGCKAIAARPALNPGLQALRNIADEPPFSEEPFADDIRATIAARKATIPTATPEEEEVFTAFEAEQKRQDALKPEVFDIVGFTQNYFGMGKGA